MNQLDPSFSVNIEEMHGVLILGISGSLTGQESCVSLIDQLKMLLQKGQKQFVLDMRSVDWINSSGIGFLMRTLATINKNNGQLKLARPSSRVKNILEITHFNELVEVIDNLEKAIYSF